MTFLDWLFDRNISTPSGDYSYKAVHLISVGIILATLGLLIWLAVSKKVSERAKNILIKSIAIAGLAFEVLWRVIFYLRGDSLTSLWPFYPCNLAAILLPIAVLTDSKIMKQMFYVFGFLGGIITYLFPQGLFPYPFMTFSVLKTVLQHTSILFIPAFEIARGTYKIRLKDFWLMLCGIIVHLFNSEIVSIALEHPGDYMYLRSTLPFVIPHVPQFITMGTTILLVLLAIYFFADIKTIINYHKKKKEKKILQEQQEEEEFDLNELFQ